MILNAIIITLFFFAGTAKLFRAKPLKKQFVEFGFSSHLILIVGLLEIVGSICLLVPVLSIYAHSLLIILMLGAIFQHIQINHSIGKIAPSAILLILLTINLIINYIIK